MRYFFISLLLFVNISYAQKGNVKGKITDGTSPISSVNVVILDTELGTAADENGNYEIKNILVGEYKIRFSAVGYESKTFDLVIRENGTTELNVALNEKIIEVGVVEVT